eukprot:scaffold13923_cov26-Tisochrysis_lutea.AAC.5
MGLVYNTLAYAFVLSMGSGEREPYENPADASSRPSSLTISCAAMSSTRLCELERALRLNSGEGKCFRSFVPVAFDEAGGGVVRRK